MPHRLLAAIAALLFAIVQGWLLQIGDGAGGWRQTPGLDAELESDAAAQRLAQTGQSGE